MPKPSTHDEYLASLIPPSMAAGVDRRVFMKGALGSAAALSLPALLAACGGSSGERVRRHVGSSAKPTGTVTVGSNHSDPVPKKAFADMFAGVHDQVGREDRRQHRRPQQLPGEHQHLSAGHPGRRLHLVLRLPDAVLRRPRASPATSATSGRRSAETSPTRFKAASTGDDGKQYFVADLQLPVGRDLPEEPVRRPGLRGPQDDRRVQDARRQDEEGRDHPRSRSPTRTAGRRWAPSTSSTCASTAMTSTSA